MPVVVVPANERSLTPLPEQRKEKFLAHLEMLLDAVAQLSPEAASPPSPYDPPAADEPGLTATQSRMIGHACTVCQGFCCQQGAEHAFQDVASLREIMANEELTPAAVRETYRAAFPTISYTDSCVFHTSEGCALPRALRSHMCNRWLCRGLRRWLEGTAEQPESTVAYVVATPEYQPRAVRAAWSTPEHAEPVNDPAGQEL